MRTKNYINLMVKSKQSFNFRKHLPLLIILAVLLLVLCKFFVVDRIVKISDETARVNELQMELEQANKQISAMSDKEEMYAHYTTSGMTKEELSRVDRVQAMKMVDKAFSGGIVSTSWNLTGNVMTLEVSGPSLGTLNKLASDLEKNPIVERCVITSADKTKDEKGNVVVTFTIYLQQTADKKDGGNK